MSNDLNQAGKPLSVWLFAIAAMVLVMAVIGAVTRLTESGLSMVEWKPLIGAIPPLNDAEWQRVFDLYRDTPEFQKKNSWMEIGDFKSIFFWEWLHRLWGRLIGLAYTLPLAFFWLRGMIPPGYKGKLLIGLALGGLQGALGWYMVMSGLVDRPSVSHFRLAAHLVAALLIYGYVLWLALDLWGRPVRGTTFCLRRHGWIAMGFVVLTIVWGAFTAGLDGGLLYNSWPLMGGQMVPPEVGGAASLVNDPAGVQFVHRWIAVIAAFSVLTFAWRVKDGALAAMVFLQIALGLATLLSQVHLHTAAAHQAGAFILAGLMIRALFLLRSEPRA